MAFPSNVIPPSQQPLSELLDIWERQGYVFEASTVTSIAAGASNKTIFVAGSRPVILFDRQLSYDGVGVNAAIFRSPTYTGGTLVTEINNANDIIAQANTANIYSGATVTADGIQTRSVRYIFGTTSNQGAGDALRAIQSPQLLLPGAVLNLVLTNRDTNAAQNIASHLRWAEPPTIPGLVIQNGQFVSYNGVNL